MALTLWGSPSVGRVLVAAFKRSIDCQRQSKKYFFIAKLKVWKLFLDDPLMFLLNLL
jgi:hypothetical protein